MLIVCFVSIPVSGYGTDPNLEVNLIDAITLMSVPGISQVPGYHNEGAAYYFEESKYAIYVCLHICRTKEKQSMCKYQI